MEHKHKYLLEVFDENEMPFPVNQSDYADFDERDTFDLKYTLVCWLYERLRFFQEGTCIDLNFHKFDIDGEELTQAQSNYPKFLKMAERELGFKVYRGTQISRDAF